MPQMVIDMVICPLLYIQLTGPLHTSPVGLEYRPPTATEGVKEMCDANGLQRLLYLQTENTSVDSEVLGMSFVEDGEIRLPPEDTDDWPYANVLEAMKDGWRIIKFPELTLLYHDPQNLTLGCEFILEK